MKVAKDSIDWAIKHLLNFGVTDVFPNPFEVNLLNNWSSIIKNELSNIDIMHYQPSSLLSSLVPKRRNSFRICSQPDITDSIIFTSLIYELGHFLENTRIPPIKQRIFSYRYKPNNKGVLYNYKYTFNHFLSEAQKKAKQHKNKFIVVADISYFYNSIDIHRTEEQLEKAFNGEDERYQAINHFLKKWNLRRSKGLPIGMSSMRLLAEITLNELDVLLYNSKINFIRYVDDYFIFCKSKQEAIKHLIFLADQLYELMALLLNPRKTHIFDKDEFLTTHLSKYRLEDEVEIEEVGYMNSKSKVKFDELPEYEQQKIIKLRLGERTKMELEKEDPDFGLVKYYISIANHYNLDLGPKLVRALLLGDKYISLYPMAINQICLLKDDNEFGDFKDILKNNINKSPYRTLEYYRMWTLYPFSKYKAPNGKWLQGLFNKYNDEGTRIFITLAMSNNNVTSWFKSIKRSFRSFGKQVARAVLYGAKCLSASELRAFYKEEKRGAILMDRVVMKDVSASKAIQL